MIIVANGILPSLNKDILISFLASQKCQITSSTKLCKADDRKKLRTSLFYFEKEKLNMWSGKCFHLNTTSRISRRSISSSFWLVVFSDTFCPIGCELFRYLRSVFPLAGKYISRKQVTEVKPVTFFPEVWATWLGLCKVNVNRSLAVIVLRATTHTNGSLVYCPLRLSPQYPDQLGRERLLGGNWATPVRVHGKRSRRDIFAEWFCATRRFPCRRISLAGMFAKLLKSSRFTIFHGNICWMTRPRPENWIVRVENNPRNLWFNHIYIFSRLPIRTCSSVLLFHSFFLR